MSFWMPKGINILLEVGVALAIEAREVPARCFALARCGGVLQEYGQVPLAARASLVRLRRRVAAAVALGPGAARGRRVRLLPKRNASRATLDMQLGASRPH